MKTRFLFLTLSLVAILLTFCAPPAIQTPAPSLNAVQLPTATQLIESSSQPQVMQDAPALTAIPVATSRGPNLEATDPTTVSLASGSIELIEFFRFT